jgi:hypothetical protein
MTRATLCLSAAALFFCAAGLSAMSPVSEVMIGARAAKAVRNQQEKAEEQKAQAAKLSKLRQRYPNDVANYESLEKSDPHAASMALNKMIVKYYEETGEDLNKEYEVKHHQGPVKRLLGRMKEDDSSYMKMPGENSLLPEAGQSSAPSAPAAASAGTAAHQPSAVPSAPSAASHASAVPAAPSAPSAEFSAQAAGTSVSVQTPPQQERHGIFRGRILKQIRDGVNEGRDEAGKAVDSALDACGVNSGSSSSGDNKNQR